MKNWFQKHTQIINWCCFFLPLEKGTASVFLFKIFQLIINHDLFTRDCVITVNYFYTTKLNMVFINSLQLLLCYDQKCISI